MSPDPVFTVGQRVVATGRYVHSLTEGKEYVVTDYTERLVTPSFTFPPYVTVMGDLGKPVTGHTHRFKPAPCAGRAEQTMQRPRPARRRAMWQLLEEALRMMLHWRVYEDAHGRRWLCREYPSAWGWGWERVKRLQW